MKKNLLTCLLIYSFMTQTKGPQASEGNTTEHRVLPFIAASQLQQGPPANTPALTAAHQAILWQHAIRQQGQTIATPAPSGSKQNSHETQDSCFSCLCCCFPWFKTKQTASS